MNTGSRWEYSTIRDMQNRIRLLEMDNELVKSQMLTSTNEIRHAFMELAEKMDSMESKLTQLIQSEKVQPSSSYSSLFQNPVETNYSRTTENMDQQHGLDAMACVETVMDTAAAPENVQVMEESVEKNQTVVLKSLDNAQNQMKKEVLGVRAREVGTPSLPKHVVLGKDGRKRYDCSVCGKSFSQSSGLSRHHKIHLRKQLSVHTSGGNAGRFTTRPKRFFCNHRGCKSSFTSRSGMTKHVKHFHREAPISSSGLISRNHAQLSLEQLKCLSVGMDTSGECPTTEDATMSDEGWKNQQMSPASASVTSYLAMSDEDTEESIPSFSI